VHRVLIIDDDAGTLYSYKAILRAAGYQVATAALGEDGIAAAQRDQFDVVLCDLRLPDVSGIEVIRQIHESCASTAIVLVTAWGGHETWNEAQRSGATSFVAKPLIGDDLVRAVEGALRRLTPHMNGTQPARIGYAARRWSSLVIRAIDLVEDPKTVLAWCRMIGVARGTLKTWCGTAGTTPGDSLDLARLLHVVIHHPGEPWDLCQRLDIIDERTAHALMLRAGLGADCALVPDLDSFLTRQRLIEAPELVEALRERLLRV
jgi:DNA-binding response OmpR family regulator